MCVAERSYGAIVSAALVTMGILQLWRVYMLARYNPSDLLTLSRTLLSKSCRLSRHILAASTFAGLSSLGSASIDMTDISIFSTD